MLSQPSIYGINLRVSPRIGGKTYFRKLKNSFLIEIQCNGNKLFPEFICEVREVLDKLDLDHIDKPELRDNLDKVIEIQYLIIRNSPIRILTDIIDGKKSLKRLKLINISLANGWKWGPVFSQLNMLMDFQLKETKLPTDQLVISGDEDQMTNNNMISFSVNKCDIQTIESNITKKWIHLKMISLAHNCIQELNRDWLPPKLESLWSLDFSYNNISWIPEDFFGGMTALRKLRLDNNGFTTLHEMWFRHIWEGLHELWIDRKLTLICR